jgi:hypothetical protein
MRFVLFKFVPVENNYRLGSAFDEPLALTIASVAQLVSNDVYCFCESMLLSA